MAGFLPRDARPLSKGVVLSERTTPFGTPKKRKGCALDPPLSVPAMPMLHALRKELPSKKQQLSIWSAPRSASPLPSSSMKLIR